MTSLMRGIDMTMYSHISTYALVSFCTHLQTCRAAVFHLSLNNTATRSTTLPARPSEKAGLRWLRPTTKYDEKPIVALSRRPPHETSRWRRDRQRTFSCLDPFVPPLLPLPMLPSLLSIPRAIDYAAVHSYKEESSTLHSRRPSIQPLLGSLPPSMRATRGRRTLQRSDRIRPSSTIPRDSLGRAAERRAKRGRSSNKPATSSTLSPYPVLHRLWREVGQTAM